MSENVSLKTPDQLQKSRKTQGLIILLLVILGVALIGALTKGKKERIEPVTWSSGKEVDTKELELSNLRAEMKGLTDKFVKMDQDYKERLAAIQKESEDRFNKKIESLEAELGNRSEVKTDIKKSSNILGEGVDDSIEFDTYSLPTMDGKSVIKDIPISQSVAIPAPPKIKRISASELNQPKPNQNVRVSEEESFGDDFSVIDPSKDTEYSNLFTNDEAVSVKKRLVKNPMAGFIPATSSASIVLFTGLDAIANGAAQGNPEPVLFRVQDDAFLAGDARYRLSNCNGTAVGYGDLSTTRVKLQATRIVCVDQLENRLLEAEVNGFITDSDGTLGMRGEVQNREGQIAGKALAASFAEGASNILTAAGTTVSNANGVTQTTSVLDSFQNGFASGTSNAASMLAERYIEQMEAISPSITVEKGRRAVLHFISGTKLVWKEYQGAYIEEITPTSTN